MPNHVTHRVIITGPEADLAAFEARCIQDAKPDPETGKIGKRFDFNTLIPMPPSLGIESGSVVSMGLASLGQADPDDSLACSSLDFFLGCPWAKEAGLTDLDSFRAWVERRHPNAIPLARQAIENIANHGHSTWYGWCVDRWGTKWNAYDFHADHRTDGLFEFHFDTAWSVPEPIFAELSKAFPTLAIRIASFDEGWCYAARGFYLGGRGGVEDLEADDSAYAEVYGEWPEHDKDDDEDEEGEGSESPEGEGVAHV